MNRWVEEFADAVAQQTDALRENDYHSGNKHAKRCVMAFEELRACGDAGREALVPLLAHPRGDVRAMAACFLLRHRTREAMAVLRTEAAGEGLTAFGASEAIKRWEEGTWNLDPP